MAPRYKLWNRRKWLWTDGLIMSIPGVQLTYVCEHVCSRIQWTTWRKKITKYKLVHHGHPTKTPIAINTLHVFTYTTHSIECINMRQRNKEVLYLLISVLHYNDYCAMLREYRDHVSHNNNDINITTTRHRVSGLPSKAVCDGLSNIDCLTLKHWAFEMLNSLSIWNLKYFQVWVTHLLSSDQR